MVLKSFRKQLPDGLHGQIDGRDLIRAPLELIPDQLLMLHGVLVLHLMLERSPEVGRDRAQLHLGGVVPAPGPSVSARIRW